MRIVSGDLVLRDMTWEDIERYIRWNTVEREWMDWDAPWEQDEQPAAPEAVRERMERFLRKPLPDVRTSLEIEYQGQHVGWVSAYFVDDDPQKLAIGIDLPERDVRGKGVGTQAFRMFAQYHLFHGRDRVYTQTWSGNLRMQAVMRKCGFVEWRRLPGIREVRGAQYDALTFELTQERFWNRFDLSGEAGRAMRAWICAAYGCDGRMLSDGRAHVVPCPVPRAENDPYGGGLLRMVTFGAGTVVSVRPDLVSAFEALPPFEPMRMFEGEPLRRLDDLCRANGAYIWGSENRYLFHGTTTPPPVPEGYAFRLWERDELEPLYWAYPHPLFHNALSYSAEKDVLALTAEQEGKVVAVAGCDDRVKGLWQIGVDTLPEHRRRGLSAYLTWRLAEEILSRSAVPFYTTWPANLASARTAARAGFLPVCVEVSSIRNAGEE